MRFHHLLPLLVCAGGYRLYPAVKRGFDFIGEVFRHGPSGYAPKDLAYWFCHEIVSGLTQTLLYMPVVLLCGAIASTCWYAADRMNASDQAVEEES